MTRRRHGPALLRCRTTIVLLTGGGGPAHGAERALLLDVSINAHPARVVADFRERAGQLFARRDELATLGLQPGPGDAADELPLGAWAGLTYHLDEGAQTLHLTVPPTLLRPTRLKPAGAPRADRPPIESGWGAVLNYDLIGTGLLGTGLKFPGTGSLAERVLAQALLDGRVFSPFGVLATGYLGRGGAGDAAFTRLDSNWIISDPDRMLRARGGDLVSSGLSWSRPVRLGGVQLGTDFATRPVLVTFPTPTIAGTVAVPSSIDVLVNGVRLLGQDVQPGPFEVRQLPVVTGAGEVSVVTRDATGQDVRRSLPIYASAAMLAPGLASFSVEAGLVRLNYGLAGGDYRSPAGAVTYRHGLADWLTLEGHAEASLGGGTSGRRQGTERQGTAPLVLAGGGLATAVPRLGGLALGLAGTANTSTATVRVTCNPGLLSLFVNYTVQFTGGGSGQISNRAMSGPGGSLHYQIYRDVALTQPWGDGTSGTSYASGGVLLGILFPINVTLTAYGRVPAGQPVGPGAYTDSVVVVVSY